MQINQFDIEHLDDVGSVRGTNRPHAALLTGQDGAPDNYQLLYDLAADDQVWTSPRHRHNFDQVRYVIEGNFSVGSDAMMTAGWVGYFPESAFYGPQLMDPNLKLLVLQCGWASGLGFASVEQRRLAMIEMVEQGGSFEEGMYTWFDDAGQRHNQDAFEALWEHINKEKISYPKSRFASIVLMDSANFDWKKDADSPGVAYKWLGTFTEHDLRIGFIQLQRGASLSFGSEKASEVMFLQEGSISHRGIRHDRLTAFGTTPQDAPETLIADEDSEFFYVKLATF